MQKRPRHTNTSSGSSSRKRQSRSATAARAGRTRKKPRNRNNDALSKKAFSVHTSNGELVITRRNVLFGAAAIGVIGAIGFGGKAIMDALPQPESPQVLTVSSSNVTKSDNLTETDISQYLSLSATAKLPYGTLIWSNSDEWAACLIPCETSSPLTQIGALSLNSGSMYTIVSTAEGTAQGFEIYDARLSNHALIWTEANILSGIWRIYTATWSNGSLGNAVLADEGNSEWETPTIAACGEYGFWQIMPKTTGSYTKSPSILKRVKAGSSNAEEVFSSPGHMACAPYALDDTIAIAPRQSDGSSHYDLTLLDAVTGSVLDTLLLPSSMKPFEIGYGNNGFMFSFNAIYSYGDGISNLGTYTPKAAPTNGSYSDVAWFAFTRNPTAPPCWCGNSFIVKSTSSVCAIDLTANQYGIIPVTTGSDSYGDYLASTGKRNKIVTFANVNSTPINAEAVYCTYVQIYSSI